MGKSGCSVLNGLIRSHYVIIYWLDVAPLFNASINFSRLTLWKLAMCTQNRFL